MLATAGRPPGVDDGWVVELVSELYCATTDLLINDMLVNRYGQLRRFTVCVDGAGKHSMRAPTADCSQQACRLHGSSSDIADRGCDDDKRK
jgi:hypothetical protein